MDQLHWTSACSVGNPLLDRQHHKMLDLANLCGSLTDLTDNSVLHELLNEMVELNNEHMETEEKILQKNKYPDFEKHKAEHDTMREQLTNLVCRAMVHDLSLKDLHTFIHNWWKSHVLGSDRKAMPYMK